MFTSILLSYIPHPTGTLPLSKARFTFPFVCDPLSWIRNFTHAYVGGYLVKQGWLASGLPNWRKWHSHPKRRDLVDPSSIHDKSLMGSVLCRSCACSHSLHAMPMTCPEDIFLLHSSPSFGSFILFFLFSNVPWALVCYIFTIWYCLCS